QRGDALACSGYFRRGRSTSPRNGRPTPGGHPVRGGFGAPPDTLNPRPETRFAHFATSSVALRRDQAARDDRPRTRPAVAAALARPARAGLLRWADLPPRTGDP